MVFFFFNDTATTEIYTLSLHDALPISGHAWLLWHLPAGHRLQHWGRQRGPVPGQQRPAAPDQQDRKSTRLNSSHANTSYAVFCLKKKQNLLDYPPSYPPSIEPSSIYFL